MPTSRVIRIVASLGLGLAALWGPGPANASCVLTPDGQELWRTADAAFVGTVTGIANNARWATVHVEEVWVGPDQPAEVVVQGGPGDPGTMTSVDRTYEIGVRYLFAVMVIDDTLQDNACSGTMTVDGVDLDAMRPTDVRPPAGGGGDTVSADGGIDLGGLGGPLLVAIVIGGGLLATVFLARRREA